MVGVETENINVQITSILSNILLIALRKLLILGKPYRNLPGQRDT